MEIQPPSIVTIVSSQSSAATMSDMEVVQIQSGSRGHSAIAADPFTG